MPRGRPSKLGRKDGVPLVAFRVSQAERDAIQSAAGLISVNEFARRRTLAGLLPEKPAQIVDQGSGRRVVYDE